jgi:hypothetical protein
MRVCPHPGCAELNPPTAEECHTCGRRLIPRTPPRPTPRQEADDMRTANARIAASHMQAGRPLG